MENGRRQKEQAWGRRRDAGHVPDSTLRAFFPGFGSEVKVRPFNETVVG